MREDQSLISFKVDSVRTALDGIAGVFVRKTRTRKKLVVDLLKYASRFV